MFYSSQCDTNMNHNEAAGKLVQSREPKDHHQIWQQMGPTSCADSGHHWELYRGHISSSLLLHDHCQYQCILVIRLGSLYCQTIVFGTTCFKPYWEVAHNILYKCPVFSVSIVNHSTKTPVTTMLTYPWKCTVLHCNHLGNTWKPLVLMTQHFDYCPSASEC